MRAPADLVTLLDEAPANVEGVEWMSAEGDSGTMDTCDFLSSVESRRTVVSRVAPIAEKGLSVATTVLKIRKY